MHLFFEPQRSQFELNWTMLGIPIRVHPFFWMMSAMMGWSTLRFGVEFLILWIACVFVSILVHEMGHVLMGRLFGSEGHIVLYSFGGLAVGSSALRHHWQRIAVYVAGPAAGFALFGIVWAVRQSIDPQQASPLMRAGIRYLIWINVFWGIMNLLPIWPLDGGQISRDLLDWISPGRGVRVALGISFIVAALLALNALYIKAAERPLHVLDGIPGINNMDPVFAMLFFGFLAVNSFQALQIESRPKPWEREWDSWQ
jgi:stage IV sporulation protein FB